MAYQNQAATYQLADALWDMNEIIDDPTWGMPQEDQDDFFPGFFAQDIYPTFDNARLGLPPNRSMEVLYYNMDWLTELGYDAPPATPEEFKEMACAATANPYSGATAEGSIGYELSIDASRFASWSFAFGGNVFSVSDNEFTYDDPAGIQAWEFVQSLFADGCATIVTESYGDQTDFGAGTLLFTVGSSSGLPYYGSAVSEGANFNWVRGRAAPHWRSRSEHLRRQRQHPEIHPRTPVGCLDLVEILHQCRSSGRLGLRPACTSPPGRVLLIR